MILRTLGFYDDFVCIGGACKKSCCIGWELDIDEATCDYYLSLPGAFGDRLREHLAAGSFREEDCQTFSLTIDGRCPFLNEEGLCDIVLTLGPEALCEICSEYPRYTFELGNAVEKSLTISCEEAARLMFTRTRPLRIVETPPATPQAFKEGGGPAMAPEGSAGENEDIACEVTWLRARLLDILTDRRLPLNERVARAVGFTEKAQSLINRAGLLDRPLMENLQALPAEEAAKALKAGKKDLTAVDGRSGGLEGDGKGLTETGRDSCPEGDAEELTAVDGRSGGLEGWGQTAADEDDQAAMKSSKGAMAARWRLLEGCEVLSEEWIKAKERVRRAFSEKEPVWEDYMAGLFYPRQVDYEHLLVYFVFRYFPRAAYDFDAAGKLAFAVFMTLVIRDLDWAAFVENGGRFGIADRIRNAGIVSREIEHSEYNLDTLFEDIAFDSRFQGDALIGQL